MGPWGASSIKEVSMNGKRLALAALVAGVVVASAGGPSDSTGQTQDAPGLTYGGMKDRYATWLRLDPGRRAIAAMQVDWTAAPKRCSNRKTYSSTLYAGYEEFNPIGVNPQGEFKRTIIDRYSDGGTRYEEHQVVNGTIAGEVATGSLSGRVRIVKPGGQVVRCTFGPQRWRLVD
jgi:hypothetical protein